MSNLSRRKKVAKKKEALNVYLYESALEKNSMYKKAYYGTFTEKRYPKVKFEIWIKETKPILVGSTKETAIKIPGHVQAIVKGEPDFFEATLSTDLESLVASLSKKLKKKIKIKN